MSVTIGLFPWDRIMLTSGITHVCIVVRDLDKAMGNYVEKFGVGPFTVREIHTPATHAVVRGEPSAYTLKFAYARSGGITLELVQPIAGNSLQAEFLVQRGEGLHHVGFASSEALDDELRRWSESGIKPLQVNRRDDARYGWAYMDTADLVGCILEVICDPPLGWWTNLSLANDLPQLQGKG